jgi:anti-sigma28 factor (negative regulator of flagellin synthesis)
MIINNNDTPGASRLNLDQTSQTNASSRTKEAGASQSSTGPAAPGTDSTSLTSSANLIQQALTAGVDARAARIQQLRALVQNNQYQPSPQDVSRAVIGAHIAGE